MKQALPANRVAAITTWLTGLAGFITGITQTLPASWQNYALAASGLLTQLVTMWKYLHGQQNWDRLTAGLPITVQTEPPTVDEVVTDTPEAAPNG